LDGKNQMQLSQMHHFELIQQISHEIACLRKEYPQLVNFEKEVMISDRELCYSFRTKPDPGIKAGWRNGYPLPRKGGVVIDIRLLTGEEKSCLQEVFKGGRIGEYWVLEHVFDGPGTKPLTGVIHEILVHHGWVIQFD
jgi:hypothetical protein